MSKKNLLKIFAVLLCLVMLITTLVACKKPEEEKPTPTPTPDEEIALWKNELAEAIANSLDLDFQNGFNLDLEGTATLINGGTEGTISLKIKGNVLAPDNKDAVGNNDFLIEIVQGEDVIFGIYNKGDNLYLTLGVGADKVEYNFKNASIFQALRFFLVQNVAGFTDLPNLGDIDLGGLFGEGAKMTIKDAIKNFLPILFSNNISKTDNTYSAEIDLSAIVGLLSGIVDLGDVDLDSILPDTSIIGLTVDVQDKKIKNLNIDVTLADESMDILATVELISGNVGIFGKVKNDLVIPVPETLLATAERSLVENRVAGTINMMGKDASGNPVLIKTVDWQLVAKLDIFQMMEKNFVLSDESLNDNFFHFQVSHKCTAVCEAYCSKLVSATSNMFPNRYKNTSLIDIAWSPSTMKTSNIVVDIALFDLLTKEGLDKLIYALAGTRISEIAQMATTALSGQFVLSLDTSKMLLQPSVTDLGGATTVAPVADGGLDIMGLLGSVLNVVGIDNNGLNISIDGLKDMLGGLLPGNLIGDVNIASLIDMLVDGGNVKNFLISGTKGPGSYIITESSNEFIRNYDTYDKAIKYNANGNEKLANSPWVKTVNPYGSFGGAYQGETVVGNPALYTNFIYTTNGYVTLYSAGAKGAYNVVFDGTQSISAYDFKYTYNNGKNLFIKYNYRGFNGLDADAYSPVYGFQNLDLNKVGDQNVTLLTGLMTGESFQYSLKLNLAAIAGNLASLDLPNIEAILPLAGGSVDGKIKFVASAVSEMTIKDNIKAEENKYNINEWVNHSATVTYKVGGVERTVGITGTSNVKYDMYGYQVPGEYTITFTSPIAELKFSNGESTVSKKVVVKEVSSKWIAPTKTQYSTTGQKVSAMDFGKIEYTYKDGTQTFFYTLAYDKAQPIISESYLEMRGAVGSTKEAYLGYAGSPDVKITALDENYKFNIVIKNAAVTTKDTKVEYSSDGKAKLTLNKLANLSEVTIESLNASNKVLATSVHKVNFIMPTFEITLDADQVVSGSVKFRIHVAENSTSLGDYETTTEKNTTIKYTGEQPTLTIASVTRNGAYFDVVISDVEQETFDKLTDLIFTGTVDTTVKTVTVYNSSLIYDSLTKTIKLELNQWLTGLMNTGGDLVVKADKNNLEFINVGSNSEVFIVPAR